MRFERTSNHTDNRKENIMNAMNATATRPPLPPFTRETATQKVRLAEDGWNSRDPEKVALAYTVDSWWRNRAEFAQGRFAALRRPAIIEFLTRRWRLPPRPRNMMSPAWPKRILFGQARERC